MKNFPILFIVMFLSSQVWALDSEVSILRDIPYKDRMEIQSNVRNQCKALGINFSNSIALALKKRGYSISSVESLDVTKDIALDIKIISLQSKGSIFRGHRKSITAEVKLYKNGVMSASNFFYRHIEGGAERGFSSCAALDYNAEVVAKDIAAWYSM